MPSNVKNAHMFVVTVLHEMRPNPHENVNRDNGDNV
jgi:hypothetical protein